MTNTKTTTNRILDLANAGFDPNLIPTSSRTVNRALASLGIPERLVRGNGYWYYADGNASGWFSSSVPVYRITDLSLARWIEERDDLANDFRNF